MICISCVTSVERGIQPSQAMALAPPASTTTPSPTSEESSGRQQSSTPSTR